jgi:DNA-binding transcriptional regulator YiaG
LLLHRQAPVVVNAKISAYNKQAAILEERIPIQIPVPDVHLQIRQRKKLGIGQRKAAKLWGFDDSTIQAWEHERRQPQGLYREKLEEVLRRVEGD